MASNLLAAERFFRTKLSTLTALTSIVGTRIYSETAPRGAHYPVAVFRWQGGRDAAVVKGSSLFLDELYAVKMVCTGNDYGPIEDAAEAIHEALEGASGSVEGGKVVYCNREQPLKYTETVDGVTYRHLGGIYRIYSQKE